MSGIRVVNVRDFPFEYPTPYVYVGRYMPGVFRGHPLANPFKLRRKATAADRAECLDKYRAWVLAHPRRDELLAGLLRQVRTTGLPLGCWCHPQPCHADVLAELLTQFEGTAEPAAEFVDIGGEG